MPDGWYTVTSNSVTTDAWTNWVVEYGSGTTSAASRLSDTADWVWRGWVEVTTNGTTSISFRNQALRPQEPTAEEREAARLAAEQATERWRREQAEYQRQRDDADGRALALLRSYLDDDQLAELERQSAVVVKGTLGGQYRLRKGWAGNVEELDETGKPIARLCIHPSSWVPEWDNVLAQVLMLETDEAGFRRIANRTAYGGR